MQTNLSRDIQDENIEDFERFDYKDVVIVVAYTIMSAGELNWAIIIKI